MSNVSVPLVNVPAHVPSHLVIDWDFYNPPGGDTDINGAWKKLHDGPDIVWTPYNGGHWILTRAEDIEFAQKNHDPFSMREINLPASTTTARILPLAADPPEHAGYRAIINRSFSPQMVRNMEDEIRALTVELIEGFRSKGGCEFMADFAMKLPITIFMRLVDLPLDDLDKLLEWTEASVRGSQEQREEAQRGLFAYLQEIIRQRQDNPGDDLISAIVNGQVSKRPLTQEEINGMMVNVVFGGLDTVASTMGFATLYLARNPEHRRKLGSSPELIPNAVEEMLRMFGPSSTGRVITRDYDYKGVQFKEGDRVYVRPGLHGMDERKFKCPMQADFERENVSQQASFGNGPHRCAGALLARMEIRVFLEEWFKRIPDFELKPGEQPRFEAGMVNCVTRVPLVWQV